ELFMPMYFQARDDFQMTLLRVLEAATEEPSISDEDPIPIFAQKLLVMLMEHGYIKVSDILHKATICQMQIMSIAFNIIVIFLLFTNGDNVLFRPHVSKATVQKTDTLCIDIVLFCFVFKRIKKFLDLIKGTIRYVLCIDTQLETIYI
ncbi:hypothetical protein ACJX0J_015820, partial [Zea mays]